MAFDYKIPRVTFATKLINVFFGSKIDVNDIWLQLEDFYPLIRGSTTQSSEQCSRPALNVQWQHQQQDALLERKKHMGTRK